MSRIARFVCYVLNAGVFIYLVIFILFFLVAGANFWFLPDEYYVGIHKTILAEVVTRVILYGLAIVELLAVLSVLFFVNYFLLSLFSIQNSRTIAQRIFTIEAVAGSLLFVILAFLSQ